MKCLIYCLSLAFFCLISTFSFSQTTFTGAVNNDWSNGGNWDNGIPGPGNNATIDGGLEVHINSILFFVDFDIFVLSGTLVNLGDITILQGQLITIHSGTMTNSNEITNNGTIHINPDGLLHNELGNTLQNTPLGEIHNSGSLSNDGLFLNTGVTYSCEGTIIGAPLVPNPPVTVACPNLEVCDGLDNDNDGFIDETCGCLNPLACNYDPLATIEEGSCVLPDGCVDSNACNFDSTALCDDGSCTYATGCDYCSGETDGTGVVVDGSGDDLDGDGICDVIDPCPSVVGNEVWSNVGSPGFSAGDAHFQSLAIHPTSGEPYMAYQDDAYGYSTTVMRFDGTSWQTVGSPGFSGGADYQSIAIHPTTGEPYVAFRDFGIGGIPVENGGATTVMRFDGTNWQNVGSAEFSAGIAKDQSLAIHPTSGEPYVAYRDNPNGVGTTVMRYDGTSWQNVGSAGFSAGLTASQSLAIHPFSGEPYVAYRDFANGAGTTVMRFDGASWQNVGLPGFSAGGADSQSLAIDPINGELYVAYNDFVNGNGTTVMSFDGTGWHHVGSAGFSAGPALFQCLAIHPTRGEPYVAYLDQTSGWGITVMHFDGTSWLNAGSAVISESSGHPSLAIHPTSGEVYVAYIDNPSSGATAAILECPVPGCDDVLACNYDSQVNTNDGSCIYPGSCDTCSGETDGSGVLIDGDADDDGVCDLDEVPGCQDPTACNYDSSATDSDGSCILPDGCTDSTACNYNSSSLCDDGSCSYPSGCDFCSGETDGTGVVVDGSALDTDMDGVCDAEDCLPNDPSGDAWQNVGPNGFTPSTAGSTVLAIDPMSGVEYLCFQDGSGGAVSVMSFDGSNWNYVGSPGFSSSAAQPRAAAFHPGTNELYVLIRNGVSPQGLDLMRFDGSTWQNVGGVNLAGFETGYSDLAFHPISQDPYVAYTNAVAPQKLNVRSFNGSTWNLVGAADFSPGGASRISLAFDSSTNNPAVSFQDASAAYFISVMSFDGANWNYLGSPGFSGEQGYHSKLAFEPVSNQPVVGFSANANGSVMTYDGSAWQYLGAAQSAIGASSLFKMQLHPVTHDPYVCFMDYTNDQKATAMYYDGLSWQTLGDPGFSQDQATDLSFVLDPLDNQAYVAFSDPSAAYHATVMTLGCALSGCTDALACNYNITAGHNDGSCDYSCYGCTNPDASNYDSSATLDDGSCVVTCGCEELSYGGAVFTKEDYADWTFAENQDYIAPDVIITRQDFQGIFNIAVESGSTSTSPANTLWKLGVYDLADDPLVDYDSWGDAHGNNEFSLPGQTMIMYLPDYDAYYQVDFHSWTPFFSGGGFSYTRTLLPGPSAGCITGAPVEACLDLTACNYNAGADCDGGSCIYPSGCEICSGETDGTGTVLDGDTDDDGVCDVDEVPGCTNAAACNYDSLATDDDGSCLLPDGCTNAAACNYDTSATCNDGSCIYPTGCETCSGETDGTGTVVDGDADDDGYCDVDDCAPNDPLIYTGAPCDDGSLCTENDTYDASCNCTGTPVDCDDGDPCTVDECNPDIGCYHSVIDSDGDGICDTEDLCPNDYSPNMWTEVHSQQFIGGNVSNLSTHPSTGEPHFIFQDLLNDQISVWRFDGTNLVQLGATSFNGLNLHESLAFHPSTGEPYLAFHDVASSGFISVYRFDGAAWQLVGPQGCTPGVAYFPGLAFHPTSQEPYLAFRDDATGLKTSVMRFDGSAWTNVGSSGFSGGYSNYQSLAFNPVTDEPYVAYSDALYNERTVVKRYDGTNWEFVGQVPASSGIAHFQTLKFSPVSNEPYVSFKDVWASSRSTVKRFDGAAWITVGWAGFSPGEVNYLDFDFLTSNGAPIVCFQDVANGYTGTSSWFNGSTWPFIGTVGFTPEIAYSISMTVNQNGGEIYSLYNTGSNGIRLMRYGCDISGCTDPLACNYDSVADTDDSSCLYPDADGDGIFDCNDACPNLSDLLIGASCDDGDPLTTNDAWQSDCSCTGIPAGGCIDPLACNYSESASIDDGNCIYATGCDICSGEMDGTGTAIDNDSDDDGVCDADEVAGCIDPTACNYDALATDDDGSCAMVDPCGICGGTSVAGCTDPVACNYNASADCDDASCILSSGCTESAACNFDPAATCDDGNCEYLTCRGCVGQMACNYDPTASIDDGSCEYATCAGCTYPDASNYNSSVTLDDGTCTFTIDDSCPADINGDGEVGTGDLLEILSAFGATCP